MAILKNLETPRKLDTPLDHDHMAACAGCLTSIPKKTIDALTKKFGMDQSVDFYRGMLAMAHTAVGMADENVSDANRRMLNELLLTYLSDVVLKKS